MNNGASMLHTENVRLARPLISLLTEWFANRIMPTASREVTGWLAGFLGELLGAQRAVKVADAAIDDAPSRRGGDHGRPASELAGPEGIECEQRLRSSLRSCSANVPERPPAPTDAAFS